jgi:hypothetical protein
MTGRAFSCPCPESEALFVGFLYVEVRLRRNPVSRKEPCLRYIDEFVKIDEFIVVSLPVVILVQSGEEEEYRDLFPEEGIMVRSGEVGTLTLIIGLYP